MIMAPSDPIHDSTRSDPSQPALTNEEAQKLLAFVRKVVYEFLGGGRVDRENVVGDVVLRVIQKGKKTIPRRLVKFACMDALSKEVKGRKSGKTRVVGMDDSIIDSQEWSSDRSKELKESLQQEELLESITSRAGLDRLERRLLYLRYYEGLTNVEAGERLKTSPRTVQFILTRALEKLRASHERLTRSEVYQEGMKDE